MATGYHPRHPPGPRPSQGRVHHAYFFGGISEFRDVSQHRFGPQNLLSSCDPDRVGITP